MADVAHGPILRFHACGGWLPQQVVIRRIPSTRPTIAEIEAAIEAAWKAALSRPGVQLFDGPMCRLESWHAAPDRLELALSSTSYKPFVGTNLYNPEFADEYGRAALANPVGVSPALLTADGFLLMGHRNSSVAYYPKRVHPFAGALDPADATPFAAISRELHEELAFAPGDVDEIRCTGIAEDLSIRQPELIFFARSTLTRRHIEARLDGAEHEAMWCIRANADSVGEVLESPDHRAGESFTPVGVAALLLFGKWTWGHRWFAQFSAPYALDNAHL